MSESLTPWEMPFDSIASGGLCECCEDELGVATVEGRRLCDDCAGDCGAVERVEVFDAFQEMPHPSRL